MRLDIVIPCYNEELILADSVNHLQELLQTLTETRSIDGESSICLVDDGSNDNTWMIITQMADNFPNVQGIKLAHHQGQQNALLAGIFSMSGNIIITLDADLQDDIQVISEMLEEQQNGSEIVYAVRKARPTDNWLKKNTARGFYQLMKLMGVELLADHADFRLMTRKTIEELKTFKEVNLFLRGMIPLLGFNSSIVYYERKERSAGSSKYSVFKMLSLAWDGITSFSLVPLRLISIVGFIIFIASLGLSGWGLFIRLFTEQAIPGWASTVLPIYFIGGIQLLSLGIIGEYIGKIYLETKRRPRYIIETRVGEK